MIVVASKVDWCDRLLITIMLALIITLGDLILTAFGSLSRNRALGIRLSQGEKLEDILQTMTVEGVHTTKVAVEFAKRCGLDMPIFSAVAQILDGELTVEDAHIHLMGKPLHCNSATRSRATVSTTTISATSVQQTKTNSVAHVLEV